MNVHVLLVITSLVLASLGLQAFSCEPPVVSEVLPSSPQSSESGAEEESSSIANTPLPYLSESEIADLQAELTQGINTWFDWAGLAKIAAPPPLTDALQNYREAWSAVNADMTTFIGSWHDSEDYAYSLNIFPAKTPGQVCVLEFKPEWVLYIFNEATGEYGRDVISDQILTFSVATVQDGHLRSSQVRSVSSATTVANYAVGEAYPVLFMGVLDDQGTQRVVALASPPTLPDALPEALKASVSQTLYDYGCITDLVPPGKV